MMRLNVSDPTLLLNNIANRYQSAHRVLLEYVDNAIDDAEEGFRSHNSGKGAEFVGGYKHPVKVRVEINHKDRSVSIMDNCRGMNEATMRRLVGNVGASTKRGCSWVNGRFGFGVHAFRAAAQSMTIVSKIKDSPPRSIYLTKTDNDISPPSVISEEESPISTSGTHVLIEGFSVEWFRTLSAESMKKEIEVHFERVLMRKNLSVTVVEVADRSDSDEAAIVEKKCSPFDYDSLDGVKVHRKFTINVGEKEEEVVVRLQVAKHEYPGYRARFYARSRRVADISAVPSFMALSKRKHQLWAHPQLLGYVEVGESVEPVITRDDFVKNSSRQQLYNGLIELETSLEEALKKELELQHDAALGQLENFLAKLMIRQVNREKRGLMPISPKKKLTKKEKKAEEEEAKKEEENEEPKSLPFNVRFSQLPVAENGVSKRSQRIDKTIIINTAHPDFVSRQESRMGYAKFGERLTCYISFLLAGHYREIRSEANSANTVPPSFEEVIDTMVVFEDSFKRQIPTLNKARAHSPPTDETDPTATTTSTE